MVETLSVLLAFVVIALIATILRAPQEARDEDLGPDLRATGAPFARERPLVPWLAAGAVFAGLVLGMGFVVWIAVAAAGVAGIATSILFEFLRARRTAR